MVARPDSPNDHLFPGEGNEALDVAIVGQIASEPAEKPAPTPKKAVGAEPEKTPPPPEPTAKQPPRRPSTERARRPATERPKGDIPARSRPTTPPEEQKPVPMDEIEAMRKRLADVYDRWAPVAVPPGPPQEPAVEPESPPIEEEPTLAPPLTSPPEEPVVEVAPEVPEEKTLPEPSESAEEISEPTDLAEAIKRTISLNVSYRVMAIGGLAVVIVCCVGFAVIGSALLRQGGLAALVAGVAPTATESPETATPTATVTSNPTATPTAEPSPTPSPTAQPEPTEAPTPAEAGPTPTPIIIVVTATPTPEPPATDTPVPTDTPVRDEEPSEPTSTPTPTFKYPAPTLLAPEDNSIVPGIYAVLKWESVGPLADDEWYSIRLVYLQQGEPVYQGGRVKETEWPVPERFFYQADGPALEYRWYIFMDRVNPDGSVTQISPESETYVFRWE
jgi:type VI secretion system secreted protein VgrG